MFCLKRALSEQKGVVMSELKRLHTVTLDKDKCIGCASCIKRCPTEAIRIRNGKACVIYDKCIACGECVRICPSNAKIPSYDKFDIVNNYKYKVALIAPSFYGQFDDIKDINYILTAFRNIGFDFVYEVGIGAELVSQVTQRLFADDKLKKPIISTACPAVLELVSQRFENLLGNLLPLLAPVDVAAKLAREKVAKRGVAEEDIGVFFISPCPAKVYALKAGCTVNRNYVDGVLSVAEVYMKLVTEIGKLDDARNLSEMGILGLQWASSGGEAAGAMCRKYLAADGIENVVNILEALENGSLKDVEFVELNACTSGCVGGVLNVENPFVARARLRQLRQKFPQVGITLSETGKPTSYFMAEKLPEHGENTFGNDRTLAFARLLAVQEMYKKLPKKDCGICGAPSCTAFCEDVVMGRIPADSVCPIAGGTAATGGKSDG